MIVHLVSFSCCQGGEKQDNKRACNIKLLGLIQIAVSTVYKLAVMLLY